MDNQQRPNEGLRELALFAGAGGGILGGKLLGWRTVCAVEWEPYPACVLAARQNDGVLPPFPIWDDVRTFDGKPWKGRVDVVSGGFPCQDISCAGKGAGIEGERSGMWVEMARIIREVGPRFVFVENSPMLTSRGLGRVLGDLATMGYDARWGVLGACDVGAPHKRERIWIVANAPFLRVEGHELLDSDLLAGPSEDAADTTGYGRGQGIENGAGGSEGMGARPQQRPRHGGGDVADAASERQPRPGKPWFGCDPAEKREGETDRAFAERVGSIWGIKSPLGRVAHGVANRVDRLKAIGNGQVPAVAALAWRILSESAP